MSTIFTARPTQRRRRPAAGLIIIAVVTALTLIAVFFAYRTSDRDTDDLAPGLPEETGDAPTAAGSDDTDGTDTNGTGTDTNGTNGTDGTDTDDSRPRDEQPGTDGHEQDPQPDREELPRPDAPDSVSVDGDAPAEDIVEAWLAMSDQSLAHPWDLDMTVLERLATGSALEELLATAAEFDSSGLRQQGEHDIVSLDAGATDDDEVSIEVCLDRSEVRLLHHDGSPVLVGDRPAQSLRTFVLRRSGSSWQVVAMQFPEPEEC